MRRAEVAARLLVLLGLAVIVLVPWIVRSRSEAIVIHARIAESGGWAPDVLHAQAGQPMHLRLTSDDVVHSFALGRSDMEPVDIIPGEVTDLVLDFDKPGTYTFYCTRWCGVNHWRMRGTIEVREAENAPAVPLKASDPPLYVELELDIDAPHVASNVPAKPPSAERGRALASGRLPTIFSESTYYRSHSPEQAYLDLRSEGSVSPWTESQAWDAVAYMWASQTSPQALSSAASRFAQNCAACHGASGAGDGVFADQLASAGNDLAGAPEVPQPMSLQRPANLSSARTMLAASPALIEGKIRRGGMGTGMPMWGSVFTDQQIWELVAYVYTFQFAQVPE